MKKVIMICCFSILTISAWSAKASVSSICFFGAQQFSCAKKPEIEKLAREYKDNGKGYIQFIQGIFNNDADNPFIKFTDASDSGYLKIKWSYYPRKEDFEFLVSRSLEWFDAFCNVSNGTMVNKDSNKYICLPKEDKNGWPIFGMLIDYGAYDSHDSFANPFYTRVIHLGNRMDVKDLMKIGKEFAPGDETTQGMIIEVKPPLAKIQMEVDGKSAEKWVKIDELESRH